MSRWRLPWNTICLEVTVFEIITSSYSQCVFTTAHSACFFFIMYMNKKCRYKYLLKWLITSPVHLYFCGISECPSSLWNNSDGAKLSIPVKIFSLPLCAIPNTICSMESAIKKRELDPNLLICHILFKIRNKKNWDFFRE